MSFYSVNGLRLCANYLDDIIERQRLYTQNKLCERIGVTSNTLKGVRSNRYAQTEIIYRPDPDLFLSIAPNLPDPLTGKPFEPERFLRIARGIDTLDKIGAETDSDSVSPLALAVQAVKQLPPHEALQVAHVAIEVASSKISHPLTRAELQAQIQAQTDSLSSQIPRDRLTAIAHGSIPTQAELIILANALSVDASTALALYPEINPATTRSTTKTTADRSAKARPVVPPGGKG
jgi:transcriptional regulator with XRE-family HTH domain